MGDFFQVALGKIIGTKNDRELKRLEAKIQEINALEPEMEKLADADFPIKTAEFRRRLAEGETTDDILPEAFALCREAGPGSQYAAFRRAVDWRHRSARGQNCGNEDRRG